MRALWMLVLWAAMGGGRVLASPTDELAGWWHIVDEIASSSYEPYRGMRIEYRVRFRQEGAWLFGDGRKVVEHGRPLSGSRRTEIAIVGTVDGRRITATLVEKGHRRQSQGRFTWTLAQDGARMFGTFESDAARSSGSSNASRVSVGPAGHEPLHGE